MKKIKTLFLIFMAVAAAAFLAGCEKSVQIGTTLTLDKDGKGERAMHLELSKESFAENVTVSMEEIQTLVKDNCPEELSCEFSETDAAYVADMQLAFDSVDDYYEKVETITGIDEPGEISITDSVFNSGISVNEAFESADLLEWLKDELVEKQYVPQENADYIFDHSDTAVVFNGEEYPCNSYIYLNETESTELQRIRIETKLNLDGTWDRKVSFYVPKDSMDSNGDAIREFLEDGVPKGMEGSWEDYKENGEKGQVYTIEVKSAPIETLEKLMQKAFHSDDCTVSEEAEDESASNLIRSSAELNERYDLSEFVPNDYSYLQIEYVTERNGEEEQSYGSIYDAEYEISKEYDTYLLPSEIDLKNKVTGRGKYNRTFVLAFKELRKEEKAFLKNQAEKIAKDLGKVSVKDKKDGYTLTFTVKGDREKVGKLYEKLFGQEMDAYYAVEHKWMGFSNAFAYDEYVDLSDFLPHTAGNVVDVDYELSFGAGAKITSKQENAFEAKGSTLYFSGSTDSPIRVNLSGTRFNPRGLLSTVLLILGVAALLVFVVLLLFGKKKKNPTQPNQPGHQPGAPIPPVNPVQPQTGTPITPVGQPHQPGTPVPPVSPAQPQPEVPAEPVEQPLPEFCTGCGTRFEDDETMYCVKCGKKRGE